jgi:hypothetical protein
LFLYNAAAGAPFRRFSYIDIWNVLIKLFKNVFENKLVDSGNLGAFYKYVNKKLNGSNGIAPLCGVDGNLAVTDYDKAALLNNYFCSVFTADNGI